MTQYLRVDIQGRICGSKETPQRPVNTDEYSYVEYDGSLDAAELVFGDTVFVYENGEVIDSGVTNKPTQPGLEWDSTSRNWADVRNLAERKLAKWEDIKGARSVAEFGTLTVNGYPYDIDEISQRRIQGAVQLAALDPSITLDWTLADNSVMRLTANDLIALGQALGQYVASIHQHAQTLRLAIDAAEDTATLDQIEWVSP